ncbi:AEC family transporter [Fodinicurvata sp. EGI_FJ10296]|uniref:AEC family transporter n=1 Tax=Fodinicurvata sp. EGI_FJ10296 TaxID=3231908 RepID=UPI003454137C
MIDVISILAPVLVPVFLCVAIGVAWSKLGYRYETAFISRLIFSVGTPCLAFSALTSHDLALDDFGVMALVALMAFTIFGLVGALLLRAMRQPVRAFLPSVMLPNVGNMGLPIALFAYGEAGLALAVVFSASGTFAHFTVGVSLASGRFSIRTLVTSPAIIAIVVAVGFIAFQVDPPVWLANTTGLLAGMTIPIMLISLGVSLAGLEVRNLGRAFAISGVRLGLGAATGFALAYLMDLGPMEAGIVIIQCSMPAAVLNYLMAARYNGPAEDIAGVVVVSTLMMFLLLPLLLLAIL